MSAEGNDLDALKARDAQLTQEIEDAATEHEARALSLRRAAIRAEIALREKYLK